MFIYFKYLPFLFFSTKGHITNIISLLPSLFHLCTIRLSKVESISPRSVQSIITVEAKWAVGPFISLPPTHSDGGCSYTGEQYILAPRISCSIFLKRTKLFLCQNVINSYFLFSFRKKNWDFSSVNWTSMFWFLKVDCSTPKICWWNRLI